MVGWGVKRGIILIGRNSDSQENVGLIFFDGQVEVDEIDLNFDNTKQILKK